MWYSLLTEILCISCQRYSVYTWERRQSLCWVRCIFFFGEERHPFICIFPLYRHFFSTYTLCYLVEVSLEIRCFFFSTLVDSRVGGWVGTVLAPMCVWRPGLRVRSGVWLLRLPHFTLRAPETKEIETCRTPATRVHTYLTQPARSSINYVPRPIHKA